MAGQNNGKVQQPLSIAQLREEFEEAARKLHELNREAGRTNDFSKLEAAAERLGELQNELMKAETAAETDRVYEMVPLTDLINRKIRETFPSKDQAEVISLLERECGRNLPLNDPPNLGNLEHIRLAVIKLADGKVDELRRQISIAKADWREVLIRAETPEALAFGLVDLMHTDAKTRDEIESRDREQFQAWLRG